MSRSAPSVNNEAAWILASDGQPFKVDKAPYFPPGDDEVVIEASHVAINPSEMTPSSRLACRICASLTSMIGALSSCSTSAQSRLEDR